MREYLESLSHTIEVLDVTKDPHFRKKGIDILYLYRVESGAKLMTIQLMDDHGAEREKYFIETIKDMRNRENADFLFSQADFLFYYFEDAKELSIIPLEETRTWIICRLNDFEKKREHVREDGLIRETEGILIPKDEMEKQGVEVRQISRYLKGKRQMKLEV